MAGRAGHHRRIAPPCEIAGGVSVMTDARVKDFFDEMAKAGVVKPDLDYKTAYTLRFVNKGVGLVLRPK
jgi:NitT/TauT family transport system substrate-binding protein